MKKLLLFAAVALMVSTASAQSMSSASKATMNGQTARQDRHSTARRVDISKISTTREMQVRDVDAKLPKAPVRAGAPRPVYHRPAGMFCATFFNFGDWWGSYSNSFLMAKPYADYQWTGSATNAGSSTSYAWDFWMNKERRYLDGSTDLVYSTAVGYDTVPVFHAVDGGYVHPNATWYDYQLKSWVWDQIHDTVKYSLPIIILSANDNQAVKQIFDIEDDIYVPMYSSKTMVPTTASNYILTTYSGASPWGDNEMGWWFGKNGSHVDGMGQAFEKPQHPYTLTNVYLITNSYYLKVTDDVTMTCKVYRLDEIPGYQDDENVILPEVPGELIAKGRAVLTPSTASETDGIITFTLYFEEDGLEYDLHPVIDYPILICIDGYNDPGMEGLEDFFTFVSVDDQVDEGFGELAYLKMGETDDHGQFTGEYVWKGLNNFFSVGTMKTGFSIFIGTENHFVKFADRRKEDGEHLFPNAGGVLMENYCNGDTVFGAQGIEFYSSIPSEDDDWYLTCDGVEELPDWLSISLTDKYVNGEFTGYVVASVVADALPAGVDYREATVRFEVPGDYIDYKFMQGVQSTALRGDVDADGEVGISDVSALIDLLLNDPSAGGAAADVDGSGGVEIADVSALIDYLLGNAQLTPLVTGNRTFTVGGVTFKMVAVEGGTFAMGATRDQGTGASSIETPVHQVTLDDYLIGETEVTQALWLAVMGSNPSNFTGDLNRPVEMVSWDMCQSFITRLNQLTGMQFRLPTEAEWEFAARGGNKARGDMYSGSNIVGDAAWYSGNAGGTTHHVGGKAPNPLGIFDMSGNVYEYCQDKYTGKPYSGESEVNPTGPETGNGIVIRGGSISYGADNCRNSHRWGDGTDSRWSDQGMRLAL